MNTVITPAAGDSFTPAQRRAIEEKDCSLLVAAGAGSGKTRVLTERILQKLLNGGNKSDVTRYLVVTFTNDAAAQLKEKLRKALIKASEKEPDNGALLKNLALLPLAPIGTINSYCLSVVKRNFEKLGVSPRVKILSENEAGEMMREVLDELIEEKLRQTEPDEGFLALYDLLSGDSSDDSFNDGLFALYKKLSNLTDVPRWFAQTEETYAACVRGDVYQTPFGGILKAVFDRKVRIGAEKIRLAKEICVGDGKLEEKYLPVLENDEEVFRRFTTASHASYDADRELLGMFTFASLNSAKDADVDRRNAVQALRNGAKDLVSELKKYYYHASGEAIRACADDQRRLVHELGTLMTEADERFEKRKSRRGMLQFSDTERKTLSLLRDPVTGADTPYAAELAACYDEIFIDEYQDVNPVQDDIFRALSRKTADGKECGRFMVGDAKQSIYRFRGAHPEIFNNYRKLFADCDTPDARQKKLFMRNNFRCAEPVIDFVNYLFARMMPEGYGEDDKLVFSRIAALAPKEPVRLILDDMSGLDRSERNKENRLRRQAERLYREIQSLVGNASALNGDDGRPYRYGDVAILVFKWDAAEMLTAYLRDKGLNVVSGKGENLFDRQEIRFAVSLLKAVDNPEKDIPLAGVLRSAVGMFDDDELTAVRLGHREGSLFSALRQYAGTPDADPGIVRKAKAFEERLAELRRLSRSVSVSEFVRRLFDETDLESICASDFFRNSASDTAAVRKQNLDTFCRIAHDFDENSYRGLSAFLEYLESAVKDTDNYKSAVPVSEDCVTVTTVHSSKGLEYPICFLCALEEPFSSSDRAKFTFSETYGLSFTLRNIAAVKSMQGDNGLVEMKPQLYRELIRYDEEESEKQEAKRLLYVAATRAKDRLILMGSYDLEGKAGNILADPDGCRESAVSRLELVLACLADTAAFREAAENRDVYPYGEAESRAVTDTGAFLKIEADMLAEPEQTENAVMPEESETAETGLPKADEALVEVLRASLREHRSAAEKAVAVPPKLTVSLLKKGLIDYEDAQTLTEKERQFLEKPRFVSEEDAADSAERGTAMHTFMQFAAFAGCENGGCEREADRLLEQGFITEKQRGLLDFAQLDAFFASALYEKMRRSAHVLRERRFNLKVQADEVLRDLPKGDDFVLVQGVIDCYFENPDGSYTVVDFKTDRVRAENGGEVLTARYGRQLAFYCRAVREITCKPVTSSVIYSFSAGKSIDLPV